MILGIFKLTTKFSENYPVQGFVWLLLFGILLITEVFTKKSVALCFCPGAIICFVFTTFQTKFFLQVIFFIVLSLLLLAVSHWDNIRKETLALRDKIDDTIKSNPS